MSNVGGFQSHNIAASTEPALTELMSLIHDPLAAFLFKRQGGQPPAGVRCLEGLHIAGRPEHIWANVNRPGNFNRLHEHGPPLLCRAASGIFYPEGSGTEARVRFYESAQPVSAAPREGRLLLFPTNLLHEVDPVWPGCAPRASIAFNLVVRWLDSPFLRAACKGDSPAVRGAMGNADSADGVLGFSAAHVSAEAGHVDVLEALAAGGADLGVVSLEGWCPLGLAAQQGHLAAVQYLAKRLPASAQPFTLDAAVAARDTQEVDLSRGFRGVLGAITVASERGHSSIVDFLMGLAEK